MKLLYSDTQNKYSNHLNESPVAKKRKDTSSLIAGGMTILIFVNILRVNSSIIPNKKFYFLFLILKILLYYIGSYFKYLIKLFNAAYRSRREIQFLTSIFFVFSFFFNRSWSLFLIKLLTTIPARTISAIFEKLYKLPDITNSDSIRQRQKFRANSEKNTPEFNFTHRHLLAANKFAR